MSQDSVTVRMYNVGFGDAFLLLFPGEGRPRRVLVDCGTLIGGGGPRPMKEVVGQIIEDVTDEDGVARIDVVVGTHRHHDHVSGFADERWSKVEVGAVWMPWTEHPTDPQARKIRERQSRVSLELQAALAAGTGDEAALALQLAANALSNDKAMRTLHRGFAGAPPRRFLPDADPPEPLTIASLPGVRVHVLGPSRDPEVIRDMDPPAGEAYLRLAGAQQEAKPVSPFKPLWDLGGVDTFPHKPGVKLALQHPLALSKHDLGLLKEAAEFDLFGVAVSLDKAVNGTSVFLVFEIGNAVLLFPGDAQWGAWRRVLDDPVSLELVKRTTFWKVGHHGSHNATPKDFVEALGAARNDAAPAALWSMVSTRHVGQWPKIPKPELLDAITGLAGHLARSDRDDGSSGAGFSRYDDEVVEAEVPI